ncbi:SUMF1/EgtB/PvdO family nonheme iron enzyme [Sorangium sp. So ce260]|uniref:formylglycine-generating enzyme family protein n=1 Tax=Sorangium sp. So ce260 TaxID=3133291 RepID=UPI003F5FBD95
MIRSSIVLIPLAAVAVAISCSSEDGGRPPGVGNLPAGSVTTGSGGDGGTGGQGGGTGGQAGGTGGQAGGTGGDGGEPSPRSCTNGVKDGEETDLDCGGDCPPCPTDKACAAPTDCISRRCEENAGGTGSTCAAAQCDNGVIDGNETDRDCGGGAAPRGDNPACPPCAVAKDCVVGSDCESLSCVAGRCLTASCSDAVKNGDETDTDCGALCDGCKPGAACARSTDCSELVCLDEICQAPSCSDGVKNGKETDIDCGGTECSARCPAGQRCGGNADCATSICNGMTRTCACPPFMVIAPVAGGGSYCIDQYEVTKQEYDTFMQANPVLADLPAACAGNVYRPSNGWPYTEGRVPVNYVDWCDAYAYCTYMGKHLCGKIGGGESSPDELANAAQSEWYNACSGQGVNEYPYGHAYEPRCNVNAPTGGFERKSVPPNPIPPLTTCEGGVTGLYHMSGNAAEWENACDTEGNCLVRGGSRASVPDADDTAQGSLKAARCDARLDAPRRDDTKPDISFRCCL